MPRKAKVIDIKNEATTYGGIAEAVQEDESTLPEETETASDEQEPAPTPAPKARAKRIPKAKPLERTDSQMITEPEPEPEPEASPEPAPKAKAKRAALVYRVEEHNLHKWTSEHNRVKIVDSPPVGGEPAVEKPQVVRKPRQPAVPPDGGASQPPVVIARASRAARRDKLYQSLASSALPLMLDVIFKLYVSFDIQK